MHPLISLEMLQIKPLSLSLSLLPSLHVPESYETSTCSPKPLLGGPPQDLLYLYQLHAKGVGNHFHRHALGTQGSDLLQVAAGPVAETCHQLCKTNFSTFLALS